MVKIFPLLSLCFLVKSLRILDQVSASQQMLLAWLDVTNHSYWLDLTRLGLSLSWLDIFQNIKLRRGVFRETRNRSECSRKRYIRFKNFNCILESNVWFRVLSMSFTNRLTDSPVIRENTGKFQLIENWTYLSKCGYRSNFCKESFWWY